MIVFLAPFSRHVLDTPRRHVARLRLSAKRAAQQACQSDFFTIVFVIVYIYIYVYFDGVRLCPIIYIYFLQTNSKLFVLCAVHCSVRCVGDFWRGSLYIGHWGEGKMLWRFISSQTILLFSYFGMMMIIAVYPIEDQWPRLVHENPFLFWCPICLN